MNLFDIILYAFYAYKLLKQFCTQLTKAYLAETSCISCYWFCYVSAHDQFAQYFIWYVEGKLKALFGLHG